MRLEEVSGGKARNVCEKIPVLSDKVPVFSLEVLVLWKKNVLWQLEALLSIRDVDAGWKMRFPTIRSFLGSGVDNKAIIFRLNFPHNFSLKNFFPMICTCSDIRPEAIKHTRSRVLGRVSHADHTLSV